MVHLEMGVSSLLQRIRETALRAQQLGTLKSIDTASALVDGSGAGPPFLVRVVRNMIRKERATARQNSAVQAERDPTAPAPATPAFNPFLPYEKSMYVRDVGSSHVLLLNKFNVVDDHVLVVTKEFEEQSSLLNGADFAAMWEVLAEIDGLAFYNAGKIAGASQRHKHLQVIGGKVGDIPDGLGVAPFDKVLTTCARKHPGSEPFRSDVLPFLHSLARMDDVAATAESFQQAGSETMRRYVQLLQTMEATLQVPKDTGSGRPVEWQPYPYNLLVTRRWMLMVPRREECYYGVSVNAMGFAGCLLVRDEQQMNVVQQNGGMAVLEHVAFSG